MGTFCGEIFSKEILYCSWLAGYIPGGGGRVLSKENPLTGERGTFHRGGKMFSSKKKASLLLFLCKKNTTNKILVADKL